MAERDYGFEKICEYSRNKYSIRITENPILSSIKCTSRICLKKFWGNWKLFVDVMALETYWYIKNTQKKLS